MTRHAYQKLVITRPLFEVKKKHLITKLKDIATCSIKLHASHFHLVIFVTYLIAKGVFDTEEGTNENRVALNACEYDRIQQ